MTLDIPSLSYATAVVILVTSAATWYVYGMQRQFPGSGLWIAGMSLAAVGFVFLGLRDHVPEFLSRGLGNAALLFALALQYHGVARFNGIRAGRWRVYQAAGLFTLAFALGFLMPLTTGHRIVLAWTGAATVYALCAWLVLTHFRGRAVRILLGAAWAVTAAMAAGRGILTLLAPAESNSMLAGPAHGGAFIFAIVVALLTSFGFLIMMTERLQDEIEAQGHDLALRNAELSDTNARLSDTMEQVRTLEGILPICSHCKKIRNDAGYWHQVEDYIADHTDVEFSHGLCPDCLRALYGTALAEHVEGIIAARAKEHAAALSATPEEEPIAATSNE